MNGKETPYDRLNRKTDDLRASISDTNSRLEDLNNKFTLLYEKVEASRVNMERLSALPASPPEGLKVVSLGEEAEVKGNIIKEKKTRSAVTPVPAAPATVPSSAAIAAGAPLKESATGPDALYNRGQDLFITGKYGEARKVFLSLVKSYPDSSLADNALYWVGESYYTEKEYARALSVFEEAAQKYPAENKAPDSLLKAAFSYLELENIEKARETFNELIKRYPESEAAEKAKKHLKSSRTEVP